MITFVLLNAIKKLHKTERLLLLINTCGITEHLSQY